MGDSHESFSEVSGSILVSGDPGSQLCNDQGGVMMSSNEAQESHGSVVVPKQRQWRDHAAVAAVNLAQRFQSDILFCADTLCINAKSSLMALMLLGALKGQSLELIARGADSALAIRDLSALFS
jgi:phosphotransferase system HPr (HPr) family protein